ncbi:MAG TPA: hypothetical protein VKE74_07155, partial [Gemmataceae bacterium]|nr:hypothetical protein [Gemmataceae bacterium]
MIAVREGTDAYLAGFDSFERRVAGDGLTRLRRAAVERFAALGFPTVKDEEWRFTNLAPLTHILFEPAPPNGQRPTFLDRGPPLPDGVIVCGLAEALL